MHFYMVYYTIADHRQIIFFFLFLIHMHPLILSFFANRKKKMAWDIWKTNNDKLTQSFLNVTVATDNTHTHIYINIYIYSVYVAYVVSILPRECTQ